MLLENLLERDFISKHDFQQALIDCLVAASKSEVGYYHQFDEVTQELELTVWSKAVLAQCHTSHVTHYPLSSAGIWADCIRHRAPAIHNNYKALQTPDSLPEGHFEIVRHFSVPIIQQDKVIAVIGMGNAQCEYKAEDVERFYHSINRDWPKIQRRLDDFTLELKNGDIAFSKQKPHEVMLSMLGAISRALEIRDEYTISHQRNVAYIANQIALQLGLSEGERLGLEVGALVHDIGKIVIPAEILNKPGKLLPAEYSLLQTHAQSGVSIFKDVSFPWPVLEIIEQHHERFDGSGYPNGLAGEQIQLGARIVAVADTFDAMATDRPYRKGLGVEAAIATIKEGRNKVYDPYVVDAFLSCVEQDSSFDGRYTLR